MALDILEVYHGGTDKIDRPLVGYGRADLDFGPGFYVTDIYTQADAWALNMSAQRGLPPVVNVYHFNKRDCLKDAVSLVFTEYNDEWLDFVRDSRTGKKPWEGYDYIEGGVADDRVISTIRLYIQGYYDAATALERLKYYKPNNQICLLNQRLVDSHLNFISSYNPKDNA